MNFSLITLLALSSSLALGEVLTMSNGKQFSGKLLAIDAERGILVDSPRSPEPLAFKRDAFKSLQFEEEPFVTPFQAERLVLANGDILPGTLLGLDAESISYSGLIGEKVSVSRDFINTLRFGIKPQALTYHGPAPLEEWSGEGVKTWDMSEDPADGLLMIDPGLIKADRQLGKQFRIRFSLKWQEHPSIRIYFGAELGPEATKNRYYIDLSSRELLIRRQRSKEPVTKTLITLSHQDVYQSRKLEVDLRVNRLLGTIDLFLNGKLIRQLRDESTPTVGNGIIIERKRNDNTATYLTDFRVYEWDAVSQIELLEEVGTTSADSVVDASGKRISGMLLSLKTESLPDEESEEQEERFFLLQSPFAKQLLKIPAEDARIIYFKEHTEKSHATDFPKYELELVNDGLVSAKSLTLVGGKVNIKHPLLGGITLPRSSVKAIRYYEELSQN